MKTNQTVYDWEGLPVNDEEAPDKIVRVWICDPCLHDNGYDEVMIRDYGKFTSYVEDNFLLWLDEQLESDCQDGLTIKICTRDVPLCDVPGADYGH